MSKFKRIIINKMYGGKRMDDDFLGWIKISKYPDFKNYQIECLRSNYNRQERELYRFYYLTRKEFYVYVSEMNIHE